MFGGGLLSGCGLEMRERAERDERERETHELGVSCFTKNNLSLSL